MNKKTLAQLYDLQPFERVEIQSFDMCLYRPVFFIDNAPVWVIDDKGEFFSTRSLTSLRELLSPFMIDELILTQQSAYDEMIGQAVCDEANTLSVTLGKSLYPKLHTKH